MSNPKSASRSVYIDQSSAELALDRLTKKMKTLEAEIAKGTLAGDKLNKKIKELDTAKQSVQSLQDQISKGLKPTFVQVENQVRQLRNELKRMSEDAPGYAAKFESFKKATAELNRMQTAMNKVDAAQKQMIESSGTFGRILGRVTEYFAAFSIVNTISSSVKSFFTSAIEEANAAEEANSRLQNTLENIGRLDVFDRLKKKADDLAASFKYLDNDDLVEVTQKLITYGKLTENQINTLLPLIINFAAKQKISVQESSEVIIKALEGNAKALKEYGISIKDGGDVTERMSILMRDLAPRVDGAAKAFGETLAGSAAEAKQELANLEEEVGTRLTPVLTAFYKVLTSALDGLVIIYDNIKNSFSAAERGLSIVKSYLTLDFEGAKKKKEQIALLAQQQKEEKALTDAKQFAATISSGIANKTLEEQQKILASQISLRDASLATVNALAQAGKINSEEGKKAVKQAQQDALIVASIQESIAAQKDKTVLGVGDNSIDEDAKKKAEDAAKKAQKLREEYLKLRTDVTDTINQLTKSSYIFAFDKIFEEKAAQEKKIAEFYKSGIITSKERDEALRDIQRETEQKLFKLTKELNDKSKENPVTVDVVPEVKEEDVEALRKSMKAFLAKLSEDERREAANRSLTLINGSNRQKLNVELANLDDEEAKEIAAAQRKAELEGTVLLEEEKLAIHAKYDNEREKKRRDFLQKELENILTVLSFASQAVEVFAKFDQAKTNKENAALNRELKQNDAKKAAYKKQLDSKLISQQQYDARIAALDAAADKKKEELERKQNQRKQKMAIIQAVISGAVGVAKSLELGWPLSLIGIALAIATTAAQIATISSTKYAKGGVLKGDSHATGGMPVINRKTGQVEAEVEGGEVILSKKTVANNWDYINPLLQSSMHQGGRRITPWWQTRSYQAVNYPAINKTFTTQRMYASGGVFAGSTSTATPQAVQDDEMKDLMRALLFRAENPVQPVIDKVEANVSLKKIDDARAQQQRIQNDAAFR